MLRSTSILFSLLFTIVWGTPFLSFAQVGIGQPSPQGALHITPLTQQAIIIDPAPSGTGELQFRDQSGSNYVGLKAPNTINSSIAFTLPASDGTDGQALVTDGSGNLSFKNSGGTGSGGAALGTDMFTQYISQNLDLWTPHGDICDVTTEVFVEIGTTGVGYCIEKNERAQTTFSGAIQICISAGKRLPEPLEWQHACVSQGINLSNMTNDWEWSSNFSSPSDWSHTSDGGFGVRIPMMGDGSCNHTSWNWLGQNQGTVGNLAYRCLR